MLIKTLVTLLLPKEYKKALKIIYQKNPWKILKMLIKAFLINQRNRLFTQETVFLTKCLMNGKN